MDFDPGMFSDDDMDDAYEEGFEDSMEDDMLEEDLPEPGVEYDELGNPILLATAAGFGHHMATDEIEGQQPKSGKQEEPIKVPLSQRNEAKKGRSTPFGRWAAMVNRDPSKTKEPMTYTKEERLKMLNAEMEGFLDD